MFEANHDGSRNSGIRHGTRKEPLFHISDHPRESEIKDIRESLYQENLDLEEEVASMSRFEEIVGSSEPLTRVLGHENEEGAMTKTEVDRFRGILTAKVAELARFTRQRDGIVVERSADQMEEIQAASQRALAVCNLDREFNQLRDARAALRRIEDGNFGTCQECDEDIHPKRLAAVPWATFCMRCQEAVDRNFEEIQAASSDFLDRAA